MTTTDLKAKIQAAATLALADYATEYGIETPGTFLYGAKDVQNMVYNEPLPHIYCDPLRARKNPATGLIEWPSVGIYPLTQEPEDSSAAEASAIMDQMEWLADRFIFYFLTQDDELPDDITYTEDDVVRFGMGRLSGKQLSIPVKGIKGC